MVDLQYYFHLHWILFLSNNNALYLFLLWIELLALMHRPLIHPDHDKKVFQTCIKNGGNNVSNSCEVVAKIIT